MSEDPKKPKGQSKAAPALSYDQINKWSDYVEANPKMRTFTELWKGFNKANPKHGIDESALSKELQELKTNSVRMGTKTGSDLGGNIHTGFSFPKISVDGRPAGRVNGRLVSQYGAPPLQNQYPSSLLAPNIPSGATDIQFDEQRQMVSFVDPQSGDIRYARREALNSPERRAQLQSQPLPDARATVAQSNIFTAR